MVIQQKNGPVPSFCACPGMCGHGELSRGGGKCGRGAEGLQRRSVSRGGKGRLVTAALAQLLWPWRSLEGYRGKRGFPVSPAKAKGLFVSKRR